MTTQFDTDASRIPDDYIDLITLKALQHMISVVSNGGSPTFQISGIDLGKAFRPDDKMFTLLKDTLRTDLPVPDKQSTEAAFNKWSEEVGDEKYAIFKKEAATTWAHIAREVPRAFEGKSPLDLGHSVIVELTAVGFTNGCYTVLNKFIDDQDTQTQRSLRAATAKFRKSFGMDDGDFPKFVRGTLSENPSIQALKLELASERTASDTSAIRAPSTKPEK